MSDAINAGISAALKAIEDLRISGAGNFFDPKYAGQRGIDRADALRDAYHAVKALSTPNAPVEPREAIATILHDSDCAKHNMPAYPNGPCDCGAEVAAKLRYLSSPDAERMSDFERLNSFCHEGHNAADLLAVRLDEAAIRKDEREKCDSYRNALLWAFDRLSVTGGLDVDTQRRTMREIGNVLTGRTSPAATYQPNDDDDSVKLTSAIRNGGKP